MKPTSISSLVNLAAWVWTLLCGLYFLWEALTYSGLFGWLAEFQIARFGPYVPLLTYLLLLTLFVIPVWLIAWLIARRRDKELDVPELLSLRLVQARRLRLFLVACTIAVFLVALGFALNALWFLPSQNGELRTIAASEVGDVTVQEGPARLVGGELGTVIFFGQDWLIGSERMAFSPYREVGDSDGMSRVFVQLEATAKNGREEIVQAPSWTGIIVEGGLPGTVRVLFNSIGVEIADQYYTLYKNEYALKVRQWLQAVQWTILGIFLAFVAFVQTRTIKKLERQEEAVVSGKVQ